MTRSRVDLGKIKRRECVVNIVIEGDGGLRCAGFREHSRGVVAESSVGMDLFHKSGKICSGIDLMKSLIERGKRVLDGAWAFGCEQIVDRALASGEAVSFDFFESSYVWLAGPDCGLRNGNFLCGEYGREHQWKAEEDGYASC